VSVPGRQLQHEVKSGTPVAGQRRVHTASAPAIPRPRTAAAVETEVRRRWITPVRVFFAACALVIYLGWRLPTERYITPDTGLGYILGIVGGSLMLLLLLYSARKRFRWLKFMGSLSKWFEVHMAFGVLGPICILYHSNFSLGATNSNVALFCMLTVASSGLVGRYFYSHIHYGLYGRKMSLGELQQNAERLRTLQGTIAFLPELVNRLEQQEAKLLASGTRVPVLGLAKPLIVAINALLARWRLRRYVSKALRASPRSCRSNAAACAARPAPTSARAWSRPGAWPSSRPTSDCSHCGMCCTCHSCSSCSWRRSCTSSRCMCTEADAAGTCVAAETEHYW